MSGKDQTTEVVLLSPPYSLPVTPSIALGIFRTLLNDAGIPSRTLYPMFRMALLTRDENLSPIHFPSRALIEEYLFSHLNGLKKEDDLDAYMACVEEAWREENNQSIDFPYTEIREWILRMRGVAERVVEETAKEIAALQPRVLAVSSVFYQVNGALAIIKRVRELAPQIKTLMGGPNCMGGNGGAILRYCPQVDAVFFGEGDEVFAETIRALEEDKPLPYGVMRARDLTPDMKQDQDFPFRITKSMDQVPVPDYSEYFDCLNQFSREEKSLFFGESGSQTDDQTLILMEGSRGCWWAEKHACSFCGLNGIRNIYRQRSSRQFFEELLLQTARYQVSFVEFTDNAFPTQTIDELLAFKKESTLCFRGMAEVKPFLSEKEVFALKELGISIIQAGIETLDDHLLKLLNKGGSTAQNIAFLKSCEYAGMTLYWNILYYIPGEQKEDYESMLQLIPLLFHLPPPTGYTEVLFERRGSYGINQERYGLNLIPLPAYRYIYGDREEAVQDFAQRYIDVGPEKERMNKETRTLCERLIKLLTEWKTQYPQSVLDMKDRGDFLVVTDTRPCRKMSLCFLKGIARRICLFCVLPRTFDRIVQEIAGEADSVTAQDVQECLDYLTESRYLVFISGKYVTLAILRTENEQ